MEHLNERVAVVTGGGGGIGRGMALAFAESGMKLAIADVEQQAAESVCEELRARGADAEPFYTDVAQRDSVEALAESVEERFGGADVLCNNAGVTTFGPLDATSDDDWQWVLGVNLHGVVHGLQAFLPRMKRKGGQKHVVNTASIAGMMGLAALGPYVASKFAVVGITETLRYEGKSWGLSASVLCPGNVATGIVMSARNRPVEFGGPDETVDESVQEVVAEGLDPELVGRMVRDAVVGDDLYVFTHPEQRKDVARRFDRILASFDDITQRGR